MIKSTEINGMAGRQSGAASNWRLRILVFPMLMTVAAAFGCVSVKAPERITVNNSRPARVDPGHVPHISTVEQGRVELDKAYQYIRYLEDRNAKLERDKDEAKRERDEYKDRRDRHDDND